MSFVAVLTTKNGVFIAADTRFSFVDGSYRDDYAKIRHITRTNYVAAITGECSCAMSPDMKSAEVLSILERTPKLPSHEITKYVGQEVQKTLVDKKPTYVMVVRPAVLDGNFVSLLNYVEALGDSVKETPLFPGYPPCFKNMGEDWTHQSIYDIGEPCNLPTINEQKWLNEFMDDLKYKSEYVNKDKKIGGNTDMIYIPPVGKVKYLQWHHGAKLKV